MTLSIGVAYCLGQWTTVFLEDGQPLELRSFADGEAAWAYVQQLCAVYPEPCIALSSPYGTAFTPLAQFAAQGMCDALARFLQAVQADTLKSYSLPAVRFLPTVPPYRALYRTEMGTPDTLCSVATLLYRLLQQEAAWAEMRFLVLELLPRQACNLVVVQQGRIADGIVCAALEQDEGAEQAGWERLTQGLAGLVALHHLEDVVVLDHAHEPDRCDQVLERYGDLYQFFQYPRSSQEPEGFEAALGAALIAEGLYHPGLAAQVVAQLQVAPTTLTCDADAATK